MCIRDRVRGVDVSHYQGEIDWKVLGQQDIDFAYIKATEGSSHVDEKFSQKMCIRDRVYDDDTGIQKDALFYLQ